MEIMIDQQPPDDEQNLCADNGLGHLRSKCVTGTELLDIQKFTINYAASDRGILIYTKDDLLWLVWLMLLLRLSWMV